MSAIVTVTETNLRPVAMGATTVEGTVRLSTLTDYRSKANFETNYFVQIKGAPSVAAAVREALEASLTMADDLKRAVQAAIDNLDDA